MVRSEIEVILRDAKTMFKSTLYMQPLFIFHNALCGLARIIHDIYITVLAPVVQMFYSAINRVDHYPVDSVIYLFNN